MSQPILSIVIPTFNRENQLLKLLESIKNSSFSTQKIEIIIIDNAGTLIANNFAKTMPSLHIDIYPQTENLFSGGARQLGAKISKGKYILFVDDDNVLGKDCLEQLISSLKTNDEFGIVAPMMFRYQAKKTIWCAGGFISKYGMASYLYENKQMPDDLPLFLENNDYFPNIFMTTRAVLSRVHFDGSLFPHNWNETDFCFKVRLAGFKLVTVTKAIDWHDIGYKRKITRLNGLTIRDQAKSRIIFRRLYLNNFRVWLVFWLVVFPVSSIAYIKMMYRSEGESKWKLFTAYLGGTVEGCKLKLKNET